MNSRDAAKLIHLQTANKLWMRRLRVVLYMEKWLGGNISRFSVEDRRTRNAYECREKGKGYLYCHLLLGKTLFPNGSDPLFTDHYFDDISLWKQLEGISVEDGQEDFESENVHIFWETLKSVRISNGVGETLVDVRNDTVIQLPHARRYVPSAASRTVEDIALNMYENVPKEIADEMIIGLILRYRCVGGFESNQHGSIPTNWRDEFPEMYECFASPLNHVFKKYYSVFKTAHFKAWAIYSMLSAAMMNVYLTGILMK